MKLPNKFAAIGGGLALLVLCTAAAQESEGRRLFARGPNGLAGGHATVGQYGGSVGGGILGRNQGAGFHAGKWAGPNGGQVQSAGGFGYKRGVGAFRKSGWSGKAANGASGSGYTNSKYNAQTGQGTRNSSEQFQSASGKDSGYTGNTTYTKGRGGNTDIQTDNHGSYDVNWQNGQKPVVTKDP